MERKPRGHTFIRADSPRKEEELKNAKRVLPRPVVVRDGWMDADTYIRLREEKFEQEEADFYAKYRDEMTGRIDLSNFEVDLD